ncbi:MAG: hypothetical protein KIH44_001865 [Octadecabacter sp.]|nr:hypothetical protein [Octadecabacter sp.]
MMRAIDPVELQDAANQPNFPTVMCTPASPYAQSLVLEVAA